MAAFAKTHAGTAPSPTVATGPQFDNRRLLAGIIDLLVPFGFALAARAAGLSLTLGVLVVALGWGLYYCFALESSGGQTLGKRVMKLRVVSADGSPATDIQIAKRTIVRIVEWNPIGLIVMLVSGERRQRLGDMVAGTVVTDALTAEAPATAELHPSGTTTAPAPVVKEPKRRRGLKDLAKLEIGGSKKKRGDAGAAPEMAPSAFAAPEAVEQPKPRRGLKGLAKLEIGRKKKTQGEPDLPVVAAVAAPVPSAVEEPKRRRGLKDLAKLEIGGSRKKKAVQHAIAADQVEKQPKKRRSLKELGKMEIGRKKQADEAEPAAVMAAPAHAAEPLPPEALPESLRPEPPTEAPPIDPLEELTVQESLNEPEAVVSPEAAVEHEPSVEVEREPVVEHEPVVKIEVAPEPIVYEPALEHEPEIAIESMPEQTLYDNAEADSAPQPEPVVEIEREPMAYEALVEREPDVVVEHEAMSEYLPEESPYGRPEPDVVPQSEPVVEIEEPGGFAEPEPSPYSHLDAEPSPYAHLTAEPSPFGEEHPGPYAPAEAFAEQPEPSPPEVAEPEPTLYQHAPEPAPTVVHTPDQHASRYPETEAPDAPAPIVKPIETVSAMDLLMQEVEERQAGSDGSGA